MADDDVDQAPPPPGINKVEIHVGGHIIVVESADPLEEVVGWALGLHEQTAGAAHRAPIGFAAAGGQFDLAEPYSEPGSAADPGEDP